MEPVKLSLKLKSAVFVFENENGTVAEYMIRELTGKARAFYLNTIDKKMKFDHKGKPIGVKSYEGLHTGLLALTLHDAENVLVPVKVIEEFPSSVVDVLFDKSQELSALNQTGEKEAKND